MTELAGKVALITGASRGIGRGIALELASAGCDIMLTARNGAALEGVAEEIRALGRQGGGPCRRFDGGHGATPG